MTDRHLIIVAQNVQAATLPRLQQGNQRWVGLALHDRFQITDHRVEIARRLPKQVSRAEMPGSFGGEHGRIQRPANR